MAVRTDYNGRDQSPHDGRVPVAPDTRRTRCATSNNKKGPSECQVPIRFVERARTAVRKSLRKRRWPPGGAQWPRSSSCAELPRSARRFGRRNPGRIGEQSGGESLPFGNPLGFHRHGVDGLFDAAKALLDLLQFGGAYGGGLRPAEYDLHHDHDGDADGGNAGEYERKIRIHDDDRCRVCAAGLDGGDGGALPAASRTHFSYTCVKQSRMAWGARAGAYYKELCRYPIHSPRRDHVAAFHVGGRDG